jgi:hypothetical protein
MAARKILPSGSIDKTIAEGNSMKEGRKLKHT